MANHKPCFLNQITIGSTNKWLDVWDAVGGNQSVSITEQAYTSIIAVAAAFQTALQALGGTWAAATVAQVATSGIIRIDSGQAVQACSLLWLSGANAANSCGAICGYDTSADDIGAYAYSSDWQHQHGFYSSDPPVFDSKDRVWVPGPSTFIAGDGTAERTTLPALKDRVVILGNIEPEKFYEDEATGSDTNKAYEVWFAEAAAGVPFRYYSQTDPQTYENTYVLIQEENEGLREVERLSPGFERYGPHQLLMQLQP